jgi:hypothetical protein
LYAVVDACNGNVSTYSVLATGRPASAPSVKARPISVGAPAASSVTYARAVPLPIATAGPNEVLLWSGDVASEQERIAATPVRMSAVRAWRREYRHMEA